MVNHIAKPGQYSENANYKNMTAMKFDMFQQLTLDLGLFFTIFLLVEVIGGFNTFFSWEDFLSFDSFRDFRLSLLGSSFISFIGYAIYYQIFLPHVFNHLPKF